ncbi:M23 family metallopeptidase [Rhodococcoides kyotonense]|nr:M23 family metallopeptidase [Rhodococcus kyotonensis]
MLTVPVSLGVADASPSDRFVWPLTPRPVVAVAFDPPEHDWLPGHRGVDLQGSAGQQVSAAGAGAVVFAGSVAGKPVVSIDHPNGLRTTYEPVVASVSVGDRVRSGDPIGVLEPGHAGCADPCLHWGVRRDRDYLDPLRLVGATRIVLKPLAPA